LNLKYNELLSSFAFIFNLGRYNKVMAATSNQAEQDMIQAGRCSLTLTNPC